MKHRVSLLPAPHEQNTGRKEIGEADAIGGDGMENLGCRRGDERPNPVEVLSELLPVNTVVQGDGREWPGRSALNGNVNSI